MVNTLHRLEHVRRGFDNLDVKDKSAKTNYRRYWMMIQLKQRYRQQWLIWIAHWSKNDRNGSRDMTKWFCYTTIPHFTHQNLWKTLWNRLDGTSFLPHRNPLTWWHLTITSLHQWDTRLQSSTTAISKKLENGSTNVLPQNKNRFSGKVFITYLKDGQSV